MVDSACYGKGEARGGLWGREGTCHKQEDGGGGPSVATSEKEMGVGVPVRARKPD